MIIPSFVPQSEGAIGTIPLMIAWAFTTTVMLVVLAHSPASGVNVAVTSLPPEGSMLPGDQLPLIPLLEMEGNTIGVSS